MNYDESKLANFLKVYLHESNVECFNSCVNDFSNPKLTDHENKCLFSCYAKYFYAYSNTFDTVLKMNK